MMMTPLMKIPSEMKSLIVDIMGDIHGDAAPLYYWATQYNHDILIIAGDFGFLFGNTNDLTICETFRKKFKHKKVLIVPGNHDDYDQIYDLPQVTIYGAKAYKLSNNFFYIDRGEILNINNTTFLCISGADSIDKLWRFDYMKDNPGSKIWWQQEQITQSDIDNALRNCAKYNYKLDYVISHEVPIRAKAEILGNFRYSSANSATLLWDLANQIQFSMWYCGHLHLSWRGTLGDMNFKVLNINEIEEVL